MSDATKDTAPVIEYLGDKPRMKMIPLEWPVKVDGVDYHAIGVKRMSTKEVSEFIDALSGDTDAVKFPIFVDGDGKPVSDAVLNALDDDDTQTLLEKMRDFLPRRFRGGAAQSQTSAQSSPNGSPPTPGAPTAPTSATS